MLDYSLLEKLRKKYEKAAETYGKKFFNSDKLEERIQNFLTHTARSKATLEKFLTDEMLFYEEIKKKAEEKKLEEERKKQPSHLDKMIEEREKRMKKYPDRFFDPGASTQMRYFVGGYCLLYEKLLPAATLMFGGSYLWKEIREAMVKMERFYQPLNKPVSLLLKQYAKEARFLGEEARLKLDHQMMQTGGIYMYQFMLLCKKAHEDLSGETQKNTLQFSRIDSSFLREHWNGKTFQEASLEIIKTIQDFLKDFAIYEPVRYSIKNQAV